MNVSVRENRCADDRAVFEPETSGVGGGVKISTFTFRVIFEKENKKRDMVKYQAGQKSKPIAMEQLQCES